MSTQLLTSPQRPLAPYQHGRPNHPHHTNTSPGLVRAGLGAATVATVVNVALAQVAPMLGAAALPLLQPLAVTLLTVLSVQLLIGLFAVTRRLATASITLASALGTLVLASVAGAADLALLARIPTTLATPLASRPGAAVTTGSLPLAVATVALMQAVALGLGLWWLRGGGAYRRWDWLVHLIPLAMATTLVPSLASLLSGSAERLEPLIKLSGNQAEQLLAACLACTPLVILTGLHAAGRLRKPLGLWAFAFTSVHLGVFLADRDYQLLALTEEIYIVLGLVASLIMAVLAITSNHWSMRWLGQNWKRLQRLVYLAAVLTVLHIALVHIGRVSPLAFQYGALFLMLLAVRVPPVRQGLVAWRRSVGRLVAAHA